jgi:hypothetical protein
MTGEGAGKTDDGGLKSFVWGFLAIGLIVGLLLGIAVSGTFLAGTRSAAPETSQPNELTPEAAGERAIDFITTYAVPEGVEVSLVEVTELETGNLYQVTTNVSMLGQSEIRDLYITRDGKLLFPGAIDIDEFIATLEAQESMGTELPNVPT